MEKVKKNMDRKMKAMQVTLAFLIVFVATGSAGNEPVKFNLIVPEVPVPEVPAPLGSSVTLPCAVSPTFSVVPLKMRWHRPELFKTPVLLYENRNVQQDPAGTGYRGRVSLVGSLEQGNVSMKLENIKQTDRGVYICFVQSKQWFEEAIVTLNTEVTGTVPLLALSQGDNGQVKVTCTSDGWSPQPVLTWTSGGGKEIKGHGTVYTTDHQGLVSVSSWLLHPPSQNKSVSCFVGLPDQERKEGRVVPFVHTEHKGALIGGIIGGLVLLMLIPTAVVLYIKGFCKKGDKVTTVKEKAILMKDDALTVQKPIENTPTRLEKKEDTLTVQKPIKSIPTRLKHKEGQENEKLTEKNHQDTGETGVIGPPETTDALTVLEKIENTTTRLKGALGKLRRKIEDTLKAASGQTREARAPLNELLLEVCRLEIENQKWMDGIKELKKVVDTVKRNMNQKPEDIEKMALLPQKLDQINNSVSDLEKEVTLFAHTVHLPVEEMRIQVAEKTKGLNKLKGGSG